jgi:hypothetical protein
MRNILIFTGIILFLFLIIPCYSQHVTESDFMYPAGNTLPYGLNTREWTKLQQKWVKRSLPVTLCLSNDSIVNGQILFRNDTVLILWAEEYTFFDPAQADSKVMIFNRDSVKQILVKERFSLTDEESGMYWSTMAGFIHGFLFLAANGAPYDYAAPLIFPAIGFGIGGVVDIIKVATENVRGTKEPVNFDRLRKGIQKKYYFYRDSLPEPVKEIISGNIDKIGGLESMTFEDVLASSPQTRRWFRSPQFSLSALTGPYFSKYHEDKSRSISISASYRFPRRISLGYMYKNFSPWYDDRNIPPNTLLLEYFYRQGHTIFCHYTILSADRFLSNRFEISAGAGASLNKIAFQSDKFDLYSGMQTYLAGHNGKENKAGLSLMANTDFYVSRYLSLSLSAEKSFLMPLKLEQQQALNPRTSETMTFEAEEINLSSFDLLFGIRIHF